MRNRLSKRILEVFPTGVLRPSPREGADAIADLKATELSEKTADVPYAMAIEGILYAV